MPRLTLTNEQFIEKAKSVHGDKYDYSLVEYKNNYSKVSIICPIHESWEQQPNNHLSGNGCPLCASEAQSKDRVAKAASEFVSKANLIHDNKYDYSLVNYQGAHTKVSILCRLHGSFEQRPNDHKQSKGCPLCALQTTGWTRTKFKDRCIKNNNGLGILYVLECFNDNETFIKIGITSNSIKRRYTSKSQMPYQYTVLHEIIGDPEIIYDLETLLHKKSKHYKYIPTTSFAGSSTECFLSDKGYIQNLNTYINKLNNIQIRSNNAE